MREEKVCIHCSLLHLTTSLTGEVTVFLCLLQHERYVAARLGWGGVGGKVYFHMTGVGLRSE